ncbi:MAG: DUF2851 family protein [Bacteroidota bacterium]
MSGEAFLQFIWKYRLFNQQDVKTTCGRSLSVIAPGEMNMHAGPDFFNAKIRIDAIIWAGNVEIHLRASDWDKHGHQHDPAYNNVILHVVTDDDRPVLNHRGKRIPTLIPDYPQALHSRYQALLTADSWLPCHSFIHHASTVVIRKWLTTLQSERLVQKSLMISKQIDRNGPDWDISLYKILASGFGLPINSLPFEMTAAGIPYELLIGCRDSVADLEGILFGHAGLLNCVIPQGPYASDLSRRHRHYLKKLSGPTVNRHLWKFLRLRPASFPTLRISQFASLVNLRFPLLQTLLDTSSLAGVEQLLKVCASEYWNTHYTMGKDSSEIPKYLGHESIRTLILNAIVPFLFTLGNRKHHIHAINLGTSLLSELEAESNSITKKWINFGLVPKGAFESQALIQLHNAYCKQKRCLECQIGAELISCGKIASCKILPPGDSL